MDIIKQSEIFDLLNVNKDAYVDQQEIDEILKKAKECHGLSLSEVAKLLFVEDQNLLNQIFETAKFIKNKVYGKRVVLFAPLYTSNECTNNCLYCGFRKDNTALIRKTLSISEIISEAKEIESIGHKRILLICGEDPKITNIHHISAAMDAIYKNVDIRRINVESAPMSVNDYKIMKTAGVGTYVIFQETYNREVYAKMHPYGIKSNFDYRLSAIERAFEAGIDDVGIGALLGLYDYKFEVLALLMHVNAFSEKFGVGPHTISVPRLQPAFGWALDKIPAEVNDNDFKKIVAIYRLAVPYTGIILSTRESASLRDELLDIGISQVSAASKTNPGGYTTNDDNSNQFETSDHRSVDDMIESICQKGYIPSFCTACYRRCRTGENFMEIAKKAEIHTFCQPNAILTFKESLMKAKAPNLITLGNETIRKALEEIEDEQIRQLTIEKILEIENGKTDIYF